MTIIGINRNFMLTSLFFLFFLYKPSLTHSLSTLCYLEEKLIISLFIFTQMHHDHTSKWHHLQFELWPKMIECSRKSKRINNSKVGEMKKEFENLTLKNCPILIKTNSENIRGLHYYPFFSQGLQTKPRVNLTWLIARYLVPKISLHFHCPNLLH